MSNGQQSDVPLPITPLTSGTTDQPNAPQSSIIPTPQATAKVKTAPHTAGFDPDFPLLSKSKGFKEFAAKEEAKGEKEPEESTMSKGVLMQRKLNLLEDSPLYKQGNGTLRLRMQVAFWKQYVEPLGREDGNPVSLKQWLNARTVKWLETHPNPNINTEKMFGYRTEKASAMEMSDLEKAGHSVARGAVGLVKGTLDTIPNIPTDLHQKWINLKEQMGAASAMLNAELSPHMGPILINVEHRELARRHYNPDVPMTNISLDEAYRSEKFIGENYYQNTLYDQLLLKGAPELAGQAPALYVTGGILKAAQIPELLGVAEEASAIGTARFPLAADTTGFFGKAGAFALDVAKKSLWEGANGYLLGTVSEGTTGPEEAKKWAEGTAIAHVGGLLFKPFSPFLSKLWVWGGDKGVSDGLTKAYDDYMAKVAHTQTTPVAVAMAGSPAQKMSRAIIEAINAETNGAFWKMPAEARQAVLDKIAKLKPELASEAGAIDKHITKLQAANALVEHRKAIPEFDAFLKQMEGMDGTPTISTIADNVADKERLEALYKAREKGISEQLKDPSIREDIKRDVERRVGKPGGVSLGRRTTDVPTGKVVPGTASAKSLEFSQNFSKHVDDRLAELGIGKDKWEFETRGHKLLFFLNVVASETKLNGPSAERSQEAQLLMNQLMQEFPNRNLKELITMSDTLWHKMSMLEQGGFIKSGKPTRIFRQTHLGPGESPFAHEVDLIQKAAKAEETKLKAARAEAEKVKAKEAKLKARVEAAKAEKAKAAKTVKEAVEAPGETKALFVQALKVLGYTPEDIGKMKPEDVLNIIENRVKKGEKIPEVTPEVKEARAAKRAAKAETKAKPKKEMTDDEKLAAAFKKSGDAGTGKIDTNILMEVTERMFPGQKYADLTPSEQSEINQMAAEISKKGKKK